MSETFVEEFFTAPRAPVNTHEEWLLRLCAQLMFREAHVVSVMEQSQRSQESNRRRGRGPRARRASDGEAEHGDT